MSSVVISGDTSGTITVAAPAVAGSNTLTLQAATATNSVNTLATAVASTSGTSIDFTGIPSWVKRISINFQGVSTSGINFVIVQLGTGSTTYTTSGYLGAVNSSNSITNQTTGFGVIGQPTAANVLHGTATISNITGNNWVYAGTIYLSNTAGGGGGAGSVSLGAALTAVRITTVGSPPTDTFDAGSINILYEG